MQFPVYMKSSQEYLVGTTPIKKYLNTQINHKI